MLKDIGIGFGVVVLSAILSAIITFFIVPEYFTSKYIITKEGWVKGEGLRLVSDGEYVYEQDIKSGEYKRIKYELSTPKSILELPEGLLQPGYTFLKEHGNIIDPLSVGMQEDIPFTYKTSLSQISDYIVSIETEGWDLEESYCDSSYCDTVYVNDTSRLRIVMSETFMKIFPESSGNLNTPKTYINEER